jgi:putative ABC transport system permease protein
VFLQDVRYAVRALWNSKPFAIVAILCLGFGIGLNTTIFSIIDGVLLKPYPYTDPDRILIVGSRNERGGEAGLSFLDMRDLKEATAAFSTIAAARISAMTVADSGGEPERLSGAAISWDLFPLLGTSPILGRVFRADDEKPNAGGVVLLSHQVWVTRYQADGNILGRNVSVNGRPFTVIGVMPPNFAFPENQRLWIPLGPETTKDERQLRYLFAFGRLKPDVTPERALEDLNAIAARLAAAYPTTNEGWTARIETLRQAFLPPEVPLVLYLMMAGVTLVLFIACSNVANLLLARASGRRREFAVRTAIGAGRVQIVRQLLTESVVLGLSSVPLGVALALTGTRLIASQMPTDQVPYYIRWEVDERSLVYAVAVAITTALIFGLVPAFQATRGDVHESLKEGTRGNSIRRSLMRSGLVVVQMSLALVALVGALLFVRTFVNLDSYEVGFDTKRIMTMRFYMTGERYEPAGAKARRVEDIVKRVEALPGVEAAFASALIPIWGGGGGGEVEIEGKPVVPGSVPRITFTGVTPHFYKTLSVAVLRGRDFTEAEGWSRTPVAVINQTMAKRHWSEEDAIGRRFRLRNTNDGDGNGDWFTVIGVAPDLKLFGIDPADAAPPACAFVPYAYQQVLSTGLTIRVAGDPASITGATRAEIRASDPNIPTYWVRTLEEVRRVSFWQYGLYGWIFGTIGVVGLLLAAVGVYGVLSYSVSQRTQEIGVRVALGASHGHVLRLVVGQGLLLAGIGVAIGLALAASGTPLARSLLYNVSPFDPFTFITVSLFLVAVAFLASFLPARRATRVDPLIALRGE